MHHDIDKQWLIIMFLSMCDPGGEWPIQMIHKSDVWHALNT